MRYTAQFRGGDHDEKPWEWCIVDEDIGPCGCAVVFDLTEEQAKILAEEMNKVVAANESYARSN